MKNFRLPASCLFLCVSLCVLTSAPLSAAQPSSYLGWIPMQCVPATGGLVLDMRRFYEPAPGETVFLPAPSTTDYLTTYDPERLEWHVTIRPGAKGIVDIPLHVRSGGPGSAALHEAVLTVAIQDPGVLPETPTVFAEDQGPQSLSFRIAPAPGSPIDRVSAVAEFPGGSSRTVPFELDGDRISIPTADLQDGTWVRVAVADTGGRVSRAARAEVRPKSGFRWQDGVIYYAFTDRFVDGDKTNGRPVASPDVLPQANYHGGDFEGIRQKIGEGYFQDLGVNVLWLAPLNRNPGGAWKEYLPPYRSYTGYHGYWPVSHSEVEPRLGGEDGLKALVSQAHSSGMKIIADLVLKHVHVENPLWKDHRDWFGTLELPDGRKNLRIWDEHQFTTWFEEWLPGFDFSNPEPVRFLLSNAREWAGKFSLDGYRLDAVKHIPYSFWPKFRTTMRGMQAADGTGPMYFVGETFMDRRGIMSFVGPNMLDGQFDFPLYDTIIDVLAKGSHSFPDLEKSLSASETIYGKETRMSPLLGNHDKSRFMAYADGDLPVSANDDEEEIGWANPPKVDNPASYEKLKLAITFLLSIDGVPMIYYGDEVGLTGAGDPDNRRMMPSDAQLDAGQKSVRSHFSAAANFRAAHPALRYGSRRLLVADRDRYAFVRRHLDDVVLAAWNRGSTPARFEAGVAPEMADGTYRDALSGQVIEVVSGRATFELAPARSALFAKSGNAAGDPQSRQVPVIEASLASQTPRSVISAVTSRAGVTSKP